MIRSNKLAGGLAIALLLASSAGRAQEKVDPMKVVPDPATIAMPKLEFAATAEIEKDFDKYFFFNRADTSFEQALADLRECDGFARGLSNNYQYQEAPYPYTYTLAGVAGEVIANVMIAAIFGSAEIRKLRRINMRRCMGYKGYQRYGLAKDLWQDFHFEEGLTEDKEVKRQAMLAVQARVASGPKPVTKELGL